MKTKEGKEKYLKSRNYKDEHFINRCKEEYILKKDKLAERPA